jgi:hypothetical protein
MLTGTPLEYSCIFSTFVVNILEVCNEMTVSHGGEYEDDSHLSYCAVQCHVS